MAIIVDRSANGETDKIVQISNEQLARSLSIGSTWSRVRLAVLFELSQSAGHADIVSPQFAIGLTAGTASLYGFSSTNHFVGMSQTTANNMNYNVNYLPGGAYIGGQMRVVTKIGNVETAFASAFTYEVGTFLTGSGKKRNVLVADYIKSAADPGRWNVITYTCHQKTFNDRDVTVSTFYDQIANDTASFQDVDINSTSVPVTQSVNGSLDTVNIYWNKSSPPIEISDVAVFRFA